MLHKLHPVFRPLLALFFWLAFAPFAMAAEMSQLAAQNVAQAIISWNGDNPGDLFKAVKQANPEAGAITSLRELNKFMSTLPPEIREAIVSKQNTAQQAIRQKILTVREAYYERYRSRNPEKARSLYGHGDIGSWALDKPGKSPTAEMDVDWTAFGADPDVTAEVRDGYKAELLRELVGDNPDGLDIVRDFDIVVTAEGHEAASHVFETRGGIDWAKRNMRRVTILFPDGTSKTFDLSKGTDPVFELAMNQHLAVLRTLATKGGDYNRLFDASGNLLPQDQIPRELWDRYTSQLKSVDYFVSRRDTATGGCLDMAKHLREEVTQKTYEPIATAKKAVKYVYRADNIARGAKIPDKLIASDPILGDAANVEMVAFSRRLTNAKSEAAAIEMVRNHLGGADPDAAALQSLTERATKVTLRYSELAFQVEMDRIVLEVTSKDARRTALDNLAKDFKIIADEGGEYSDLARSALEAIDNMHQANNADAIEAIRENWDSLEKIRQMDDTLANRTKNYLNQTELGKKILDKYGKLLELANRPIFGTGKPYHTSPALIMVEGAVEAVRGRTTTMVQYLGSAAMWVTVVDNVRTAKTDAELAMMLGQTLAMNTYYGMIASSLYAGIVQGDAKALARAIMYMIVPETALPALVEALGQSSISLTAQILFDHQLDAQYMISDFDEQGQVKNIGDYPGRESAARALIDDLLTPGGETLALGMFEKAIERMQKRGWSKLAIDEFRGMEAIAKRALVRAIESTVLKGNPLVLKEDGQVVAACAGIKKYSEEINELGKTLNLQIPETVGADWIEGFDLGRGEKTALKKLMDARANAQGKAKDALAAGMVRIFEERNRAELELAKGRDEALAMLKELEKLFEELQIHGEGMLALEREGTYNTILGWFSSPREKQLKAMQAVLKFRDTYQFVLQARVRAEEMAKTNIGQEYTPEPRPLTGPFSPVTAPTISTDFLKAGPSLPGLVGPLLVDPGFDMSNGQKYLEEVAGIGAKVRKDLELIKGGALDGDYDRDMFRKLYRVRFDHAYWSLFFEVAMQAKGMLNMAQVWRETQRNSVREQAFSRSQALFKEDATLQDEFRQYYGQAKATIAIRGAKESAPDSPVDLAATVTFQTKPEPAYEVRWSDETRKQALSRGSSIAFKPADAPKYTVKAEVFATIQGKPLKVAEAFHDIAIKKKDEAKPDQEQKGEIKLTAPASIDSTKVFPVTAQLPAEIAQKAKSFGWGWGSDGDSTATPATTVQFPRGSKGKQEIKVTAFDGPVVEKYQGKWKETSGQRLGSGSVTVNVTELLFDVKASDIWEGGISQGFMESQATIGFRRKAEYRKRSADGKEVNSANAGGSITVELNRDTKPVDCSAAYQYAGKPLPEGHKARSVTIGDFKGDVIETPFNKRYRGSMYGYVDVSYPEASISGRGCVSNGKQYMQINYSASAGGEALGQPPNVWWDDMPWVEQKVQQIFSEVQGILGSIALRPDGKHHTEPYKEKPIPSVKLVASKKGKVKTGEVVDVQAVVENAQAEDGQLVYTWSGDHAGKGEKVQFLASKGGKQTLSVSVNGARWSMGSASVEFEVEGGVKVEIQKTSPADNKVPVGGKAAFTAKIVDGKAGTAYVYRWQPHPEVTFDKLDSTSPGVTATLTKPGKVKVWVIVLEKKDGVLVTAGESDQLEMEVVVPKLELAFEPKEVYVGQEVKARVTPKSDAKGIDFRWLPMPDNAKQIGASQDGREITFFARDDKSVEVTVMARVPTSGEDLGQAKDTIKAKKYEVTIGKPKTAGPKPQIWKEKVGLVDVDTGIAADQIVELTPEIKPAPTSGPLKYQWSTNTAGCTISNPISRDARITCSEAGQVETIVVVKDKNDVELGKGTGGYSVTVSRETITKSASKAKDEAEIKKKADESKKKLQTAKEDAKNGKLDDAIKGAEEAAKLDPSNKEADTYATQLKQDKRRIEEQINKTKKLIEEAKFAEAQKELIVAKNLHGNYPPTLEVDKLLTDNWGAYNNQVRDRLYQVRSANESKEFKKALDLAADMRKSMKLYDYNEEQLKQQENWARQWEAEKERKRQIFKGAGDKVKNYDYQSALKSFDEGFANAGNVFNGTELEYKDAIKAREEAFLKNKRLGELLPFVQRAAEDTQSSLPPEGLQNAVKSADEAIALQPNNEQIKKYKAAIEAKLTRTAADNQRLVQGRKLLETGRAGEIGYQNNESYLKTNPNQWGESLELQLHAYLTTAIENYGKSLAYIPDAKMEQHIKDLQSLLDGRKKYLEQWRTARQLRAEADEAAKQGRAEPSFDASQTKLAEAIEKYRKSLSLYRPFDAETIERIIFNLEYEKQNRIMARYRAEGDRLEKEGRIVDAIASYDKALASYHPTVPQNDRMQLQVHIQELRNRTNGAKQWRTQGEAQQKQGKIPDAITSYRQSLKLVPDKALEDHVKLLEAEATKGNEKKAAAERLWQEGTGLFNQGRPGDALAKFKESLALLPDATRAKYVQDLEGRKAKAQQLRDEGGSLQQQNRVADAIARYNESLKYWPDPKLKEHITALEAKQKEGQEQDARKARAKQLRDEGYALQQQNRVKEAVTKYKESLSYWPDAQLEKYIKDLETKIASAATPTASGIATGSGTTASAAAKPPSGQPSQPVQSSSASINIVGTWQTIHDDKGQKVPAGLTHFNKDGSMVIEATKVEIAAGQSIVCRINGSWKMSGSTLTLSHGKSECKLPDGTTKTDDLSGEAYSGSVKGDAKSFTAVFGPGLQTTYVRQ